MKLSVAHHSLPAVGEIVNGDQAIERRQDDQHLVAVIDGLGHGQGAHAASTAGVRYLLEVDFSLPLMDVMAGMHDAMGGTRGAAATVCVFRPGKVEACAVGNVELRTGSLRLPLVASPGVLGVRVSRFRCCETQISRAARLILFSDGISSRVRFEDLSHLGPGEFCEVVMDRHRKDHDDSTVMAIDVEPLS